MSNNPPVGMFGRICRTNNYLAQIGRMTETMNDKSKFKQGLDLIQP